jgi:hypothetical protein
VRNLGGLFLLEGHMEATLIKITTGMLTISVGAIIKLFIDHAVVKSQHRSLQEEVNELKRNIIRDVDRHEAALDKRFEKLETLIAKEFKMIRERA